MPLTIDTQPYSQGDGSVWVQWDQAGISPNFYAWRIYRRVAEPEEPVWTLLGETTVVDNFYTLNDYLAKANVSQTYRLVQVTVAAPGDPQIEVVMDEETVTPWDEAYWLVHPTNEALTTKLHHVSAHQNADNFEQAVIPLIDRGYHVEQGTDFGDTGSISCKMADRPEITAREQRLRIEALKSSYSELWLRTPFGDVIQIALGQLSFDREAGVGLREHGTLAIPYTEVS